MESRGQNWKICRLEKTLYVEWKKMYFFLTKNGEARAKLDDVSSRKKKEKKITKHLNAWAKREGLSSGEKYLFI